MKTASLIMDPIAALHSQFILFYQILLNIAVNFKYSVRYTKAIIRLCLMRLEADGNSTMDQKGF